MSTFDEWLDEIEGNKFVMRSERMFEDMETGDYVAWLKWLRAAYEVGYQAGKEYEHNLGWRGPG